MGKMAQNDLQILYRVFNLKPDPKGYEFGLFNPKVCVWFLKYFEYG